MTGPYSANAIYVGFLRKLRAEFKQVRQSKSFTSFKRIHFGLESQYVHKRNEFIL